MVSSPLMASTECPSPIKIPTSPTVYGNDVCFNQPSESGAYTKLCRCGQGGRCAPRTSKV